MKNAPVRSRMFVVVGEEPEVRQTSRTAKIIARAEFVSSIFCKPPGSHDECASELVVGLSTGKAHGEGTRCGYPNRALMSQVTST